MTNSETTTIFGVVLKDEDATEFLKTLGPAPACQTCGKTDWFELVTSPEEDEFLSIRTTNTGGQVGTNHIPIFLSVCDNCGHTRQFVARPLTEWVGDGRPK